ncbi:MAG TPA: CbtA family protein [Alphaproteobacteria bacterium]|jgi:cobalt transporter subunit CbtA|nr:CbtA family protein [Alphaproteobacteria bacterium]
MLRKILLAALVAGAVAGLVVTVFQAAKVWPLIVAAETFEQAQPAANSAQAHDGAWSPADGVERTGLTLLFNVIAGFGFALVLNALIALRRSLGHGIDPGRGLLWGIAGYVALVLAPSLGLPPEAPGVVGADLLQRQVWWSGTALATAAGLAAFVFGRGSAWRIAGVLLMIVPHIIGAPHPPDTAAVEAGALPPSLAAQYVSATLVATAVFWAVLGGVSGWMQRRLG